MHLKDPRISLLTTCPRYFKLQLQNLILDKLWYLDPRLVRLLLFERSLRRKHSRHRHYPDKHQDSVATATVRQSATMEPFYPLPTGACTHSTAAMSIPSCAPTRQYELVHPSINLLIHTNKNTRICTQTHACNAYTHRHACIYIRIIDKIYECFE